VRLAVSGCFAGGWDRGESTPVFATPLDSSFLSPFAAAGVASAKIKQIVDPCSIAAERDVHRQRRFIPVEIKTAIVAFSVAQPSCLSIWSAEPFWA